ncbi:MAG: serine/threonine protein kinase [Acidobacteria bacterium]|nr:serine/threonine protein kinase [Acidobacteriota bacterium]
MDRWQRIEQLFLAAAELPEAERATFVEREAAGDAELLDAVNGMLRHSDDSDSRILAAVQETAVAAAADADALPAQIDRYTVVRELGRGGMGMVYLAERSDREFRQQVAIKVVKRGMDTALIVDRFRHERRILASLNHPNIARLLDGGATPGGLPYLVMEYVEGRPLAEHCRERNLPIEERLLLFEQVCAAVQHAHQKLIVHRDLKPANILVTPEGIPKLLDFGIAKLLLSDDEESMREALTRPGVRALTPDYASPEQVLGEPVTVATDVFSLGLVLYELVTEQRAHQFGVYTEAEFLRVICQREVRPASEAVKDDARLRRQVAGDLDNIVALALRKDPARRYASVEQFASDIRRHREGHPVLARPETFLYRARKFVTRNRVPVAAAALVAISLTAGIIGTALQARRADAQAAKAERRFQQVRKLANTFVFDVYDGMANLPGTAKLRAGVVATALEYLDSLAGEAEGENGLQTELAAAYKRIGDVQGNPGLSGLGQIDAALASYDKAIAILTRLADRADADPKVLTDLGNLERTTGFVRISSGDARRAIEHQRRSIVAWERLKPQRGDDIEVDTRIAQAWGIMGQALLELGEAQQSVERHSAAVRLLREWLPRKTLPSTRGTLSLFLHDLGEAQVDAGDLSGAVRTLEEASAIRRAILEKDPKSFSSRRRIFSLDFQLASAHGHAFHLHLGDQEAAERYAMNSLRAAEQLAVEDQGSERSVKDRMFGNWILGCVLLQNEPRRALPYLEKALAAALAQAKSGGASDVSHDDLLANSQEALGRALVATGDRRRGLELMRQAVVIFERISAQVPEIFDYRNDLIRATNSLGDTQPAEEAADWYRKAFRAAEAFPAGEPRNVRELMRLAEVHLRWPRWNPAAPEAERKRMAEKSVRLWQKLADKAPRNRWAQESLAEARRASL